MNMDIFKQNLQLLEAKYPALVARLSDFVPEEIQVDLQSNDLNIGDEAFYGQDATIACQQQVAMFMRHPAHFSLKLTNKINNNIHQKVINALNEVAIEQGYKQNRKPELTNLVLLGSGMGYQLQELSKHLSFHHIVLLEPNDEMLFHFLCHTDLTEVCAKLAENDGEFFILQANDEANFHQQINQILQFETGFGFLAEVTVFRHYEMPLFDHILNNFKLIRQNLLSGWGFFEDEIAGVVHSFANIKKHPFFTQNITGEKSHQPVVLVGNGPSLDQNINQLRDKKDQFVVISCGTAIASLLNNDIIPDIHIEMERSLFTASVQQKWLGSDLLKDTFFIGLSTVAPEITNNFANSLLFTKANDVGHYLINKVYGNYFPPLYFCNPTVTNFALAATIQLGFENIYMLGCDYGYRDTQKHHSQSSDYFSKKGNKIGFNPADTLTVPDNFGQPITTSRIYQQARLNVERLLARHNDIKVTNCSDGAKIEHTQWQDFAQLTLPESKTDNDKKATFQQLRLDPKQQHKFDLSDAVQQLGIVSKVMTVLRTLSQESDDKHSLFRQLHQLCIEAEQTLSNDLSAVLFIGDLRYYHLLISSHLYRLTETNLQNYWQHVLVEMEKAHGAYQQTFMQLNNGD